MLSDEKLALAAQSGDTRSLESLLEKYKDLVRVKASLHLLSGLDREDLVQEGMIGLFKAIRQFEETKGAAFKTFAGLCIERQIITAIRGSRRQKHIPLNFYISLDRPIKKDEAVFVDTLNPLSVVIGQEESEKTWACFSRMLSKLETQVVELRMAGASYKQIADRLGISAKSVDNALQRAKTKFNKCASS